MGRAGQGEQRQRQLHGPVLNIYALSPVCNIYALLPVLNVYFQNPRALFCPLRFFIHTPCYLAGLEWEKHSALLLVTRAESEPLPEQCKAVAMETPYPFFLIFLLFFF